MLKYVDVAVTFSEFPDEIALCINISGCPNHCAGCSESYLVKDVGTDLTEGELDRLIAENPGISLVGIMGGDQNHLEVRNLVDFVHSKNLKAGMYSGKDYLDMDLLNSLDYYKIGSWRRPEGNSEDWWKTNCGPLKFTFSNQLMFKKENNNWINITEKFRKVPINNLEKEII